MYFLQEFASSENRSEIVVTLGYFSEDEEEEAEEAAAAATEAASEAEEEEEEEEEEPEEVRQAWDELLLIQREQQRYSDIKYDLEQDLEHCKKKQSKLEDVIYFIIKLLIRFSKKNCFFFRNFPRESVPKRKRKFWLFSVKYMSWKLPKWRCNATRCSKNTKCENGIYSF